ncbi:MAG TPA: alpha/beta hydrolase [Gemmataceae bacterium]|nr:alpha/beta hydrolase [Gemmataceae bacterium]
MCYLPILILTLACGAEDQSESVSLKTDTGTLAGVLDLPRKPGPWPVVLIHAGSGPTDKDGNNPLGSKTNALKMLGAALTERGIACLRIDKRGIGGSEKAMGKPEELRLETYVADAAAWLKFLRADKRFTKVGYVGHSEGSLIGTLAGQKEKLDAFVSLCGPGRRFSVIVREQLKDQLPEGARKPIEALIQSLEAGKTIDDVPKELPMNVALLFHKNAQQMLISLFKYDPAVEIGKLSCPVLVVSGTHDWQMSEIEGKKLAAGAKGAKHVVVKGMSHVLKETDKTDPVEQSKTVYQDLKAPVVSFYR